MGNATPVLPVQGKVLAIGKKKETAYINRNLSVSSQKIRLTPSQKMTRNSAPNGVPNYVLVSLGNSLSGGENCKDVNKILGMMQGKRFENIKKQCSEM